MQDGKIMFWNAGKNFLPNNCPNLHFHYMKCIAFPLILLFFSINFFAIYLLLVAIHWSLFLCSSPRKMLWAIFTISEFMLCDLSYKQTLIIYVSFLTGWFAVFSRLCFSGVWNHKLVLFDLQLTKWIQYFSGHVCDTSFQIFSPQTFHERFSGHQLNKNRFIKS